MCVCVGGMCLGAHAGQKRVLDRLELELKVLVNHKTELGLLLLSAKPPLQPFF